MAPVKSSVSHVISNAVSAEELREENAWVLYRVCFLFGRKVSSIFLALVWQEVVFPKPAEMTCVLLSAC